MLLEVALKAEMLGALRPVLKPTLRISNKPRIALFGAEMAELHSNLHKSLHFR